MSRIIAHIDLNQFFVRAEELRNPKLINRPVAVGGDGRGGIVSTCSYKAREYGVRSGMPMFKAKELCKDLIIVPVDFMYYEVLSNEFFHVIHKYSNIVEEASVDECYVDFTDSFPKGTDPIKYFKGIQEDLFRTTGLKCSIGVSTTKFLAKMASDIQKPMGLTIIRKRDIKEILFKNDVGSFFGIGKTTEKLLKNYQISTIGQLYDAILDKNPEILKIVGSFADSIIASLQGRTSDKVLINHDKPKSISCRTTLERNTSDKEELLYFLEKTFDVVKRRFINSKLLAGGVEIAFRYVDFTTKTYSRKLKSETLDPEILREEIINLFKKVYNGKELRQIGCAVERLVDIHEKPIQMSLFNYETYENLDKTGEIINYFNRYIENEDLKLFRASELLKKDKKDEGWVSY